ncbi:MAG TPA: glycosyltransferase, partial [Burkholderiaceae bacterium]|nr:glycosyltransferase [Burkholderiaceae bacterium]
MTSTVALVMIVRDEAARIVSALASARNHVDELVVLDTGSTDATITLAQAAGARVGRYAWCDDFAAARNAALALAGADWNVILDADEVIGAGGAELVALRHVAPTFVGLVRVDSAFDTPQGVAIAPSWLPRVLPRGVRYEGCIHEQPVHAWPTQRLPIILAHAGYRDAALQAKAGRNRALLERALVQSPGDAYLHYQDGKDHDVYTRYAQAVEAFERSRACEHPGTPRVGWHHDRLVRALHALKK